MILGSIPCTKVFGIAIKVYIAILVLFLITYYATTDFSEKALGDIAVDVVRTLMPAAFICEVAILGIIKLTWRQAWEKLPFLNKLIFPLLHGTWKGTVKYIKKTEDDKYVEREKPVVAFIEQTLDGTYITMRTNFNIINDEESWDAKSSTIITSLNRCKENGVDIRYVFQSQPKEQTLSRTPPHKGTALLQADKYGKSGSIIKLSGTVFTDIPNTAELTLSWENGEDVYSMVSG